MVPELERCVLAPKFVPAPVTLSGVLDRGLYEYSPTFGFVGYCGGDMTVPSDMDRPEPEGCRDGVLEGGPWL